jgi:hypothetical protein
MGGGNGRRRAIIAEIVVGPDDASIFRGRPKLLCAEQSDKRKHNQDYRQGTDVVSRQASESPDFDFHRP